MAFEDFKIKPIYIAGAVALGVVLGATKACHNDEQAERERAEAEAEPVVELTPEQRRATLQAEAGVIGAQRAAMAAATRDTHRQARALSSQAAAPPESPAGVVSIVFSANVHGEREDCGCKTNPLGGLTRRQTLVELAETTGDDAAKWWGEDLREPDGVINVDAGDLLYKSTGLDLGPEAPKKKARQAARAIVDALNVNPPDAVNIGELDMVFGLDDLTELADEAKFPFISANLRTADGEAPFEGHVVVERGGKKVALIGLTKADLRDPNYFASRGIRVEPPAPAYRAELAALPDDVDLVVLLSNLGHNETRNLVESLGASGDRVDAVIVSNTNRLTAEPEWVAGVPLAEPLSRGKYLGRLDVLLGDEPGIQWANATGDPGRIAQDYQRAWASYLSSREMLNKLDQQILDVAHEAAGRQDKAEAADRKLAETAKPSAGVGAPAQGPNEAFVGPAQQKSTGRLGYLQKRRPVLVKRVETTAEALAKATANLPTFDQVFDPSGGDDWALLRIVQVKLAIPEDRQVRRVLDRHAK